MTFSISISLCFVVLVRCLLLQFKIDSFPSVISYFSYSETNDILGMKEASDIARRRGLRLRLRKIFNEKHRQGKNKWFFSKLRF